MGAKVWATIVFKWLQAYCDECKRIPSEDPAKAERFATESVLPAAFFARLISFNLEVWDLEEEDVKEVVQKEKDAFSRVSQDIMNQNEKRL